MDLMRCKVRTRGLLRASSRNEEGIREMGEKQDGGCEREREIEGKSHIRTLKSKGDFSDPIPCLLFQIVVISLPFFYSSVDVSRTIVRDRSNSTTY